MLTLSKSTANPRGQVGNTGLRDASACILNHDIRSCAGNGIIGSHLYCGRALGISRPGDVIQLHPDLKPQWPLVTAHYDRVGLGVTDQVVWTLERGELSHHPEREASLFYFGAAEQEARPNSAWYQVVEHINSKNNFVALAKELGLPVPMTRCYSTVAEIDEAAVRQTSFPCYLKAAVSLSGAGIHRCADQTDLLAARGFFRSGAAVQIQSEVDSDCFLNLQYEVNDGGLSRLAATEQVLEGPTHQGNRCPARVEPWDSVEPMAHRLYEKGIRGVFAFDVAAIEGPGYWSYLAIECNPRFNTASYPTIVARKLGIEHWLARNFKTEYRSLADVDLTGLEYDPATGQGVVLINWGTILAGKLLFLLAGPPQVQERLALELHKGL
jgi:hypothetical protein